MYPMSATKKKTTSIRVTGMIHAELVRFAQKRGMMLKAVIERALTEYMQRERAK
jgi:predicted HicB family RNase H-like nuclease